LKRSIALREVPMNKIPCIAAIALSLGLGCGSGNDGAPGGGGGHGDASGSSSSGAGGQQGTDAGSQDAGTGGQDGGAGGQGAGGSSSFGGVPFPWPIFDGSVPDTPPSTNGNTYYADPVHGSDSNDGETFANAKKTLSGVLSTGATAGDTILLGGGIYREYADWYSSPGGKAGMPLTIGSYGHGTGAPIIDGGSKPGTWTHYTAGGQTTVWQTSTAGLPLITSDHPVLGIYVNSGTNEFALREVPHGQLDPYGSDPLPPNETQADIKDDSSDFYFDPNAQILYADFGGSLGTRDPNGADISILHRSHDSTTGTDVLLNFGTGYFSFIGITIRASSWSAVYAPSDGNTFDQCDVKYNGGGAFSLGGSNNAVTKSRVWMNVLDNWPRFNNGNTGGGWPGALVFYAARGSTAKGNVIYLNGGEGIIFYGTESGWVGSNNLVQNNVVFDNFSVNIYTDNTQGVLVQENFAFDHPRDPTQTFDNLLTLSGGYNSDFGRRLTPINISLGDEPGSSFNGQAHLANITVINNIAVGAARALLDYDDGTSGAGHGLKNDTIANNTFVVAEQPMPGGDPSYGWQNASNPGVDTGSVVENNLIVVQHNGDLFELTYASPIGPGITNDYNLYSGMGAWSTGATAQTFSAWKAAHADWDQHSIVADAKLVDVTAFNAPVSQTPVYDWSKAAVTTGSPATGGGTAIAIANDFTGKERASGSNDIGALAPP
jgi:hypothetical protein